MRKTTRHATHAFLSPPELRGGLPEAGQKLLLIEDQRDLLEEAHSFDANVTQE